MLRSRSQGLCCVLLAAACTTAHGGIDEVAILVPPPPAQHTCGEPEVEPKPILRVEPRYPNAARFERTSGRVKLRFDLDDRGHPQNITIVESIPRGRFNHSAREALERWRYCPNPSKKTGLEVMFHFKMI